MKRWIVPIVVLPGTVLGFVPALILWLSKGFQVVAPQSLFFWLGLGFLMAGAFLAGGSMRMFFKHGEGTAAPWDPPTRFVVHGLYRHVRNPMISGVILLLIAEAMLFQSWPIGIWALVFFAGNAIYFPLVEEPGLRKRFGDDYRIYCENVGRWIPRATPWEGDGGQPGADQD